MADPALRRTDTLRWRFSALFVALFVGGAATLLVSYHLTLRSLYALAHQQALGGLTLHLAERIQPELDHGSSFDSLRYSLQDVTTINPALALYIVLEDGSIAATLSPHTAVARMTKLRDMDPVRTFVSSGLEALPLYISDPADHGTLPFSAARIRFNGENAYLLAVIFGSDLFDQALGVARENFFILQGTLLLVLSAACTVVVGIVAVSLLSARFSRLTSVVRTYATGDLSARIEAGRPDEIGSLSETINKMADSIQGNIIELERRDRTRRELVANVSHDLRGPLTHIVMGLEQVEDGRLEAVKLIRSSSAALQQLLTELFELAKLDASDTQPAFELFRINDLIDECYFQFTLEAKSKDIEWSVDLGPSVTTVWGDLHLIQRVLTNLASNAFRYTPSGGRVVAWTRKEGDRVRIGVTDTGVGVSEVEMRRLFEPFYTGEDPKKRVAGSTGLGLAIVKKILDLHGSEMSVESQVGTGSTFSFVLHEEAARNHPAS